MTSQPDAGFKVEVRGLEHLRGIDHRVVFHGVNKSGSLALTQLLFEAYHDARRGNQFFSTYMSVPKDTARLLAIINSSSGHSFLGGHYLYGAFQKRPGEHLLTTQFRNPLPRVLSCYQWLKNKREAEDEPFPPFEDWVPMTRGVSHSQVEQFAFGYDAAGRAALADRHGDELLERAITNIERDVDWFGIAEYLEESAFCMAALCGLPRLPAWRRDDRNSNRALVDAWPQEHVDLVKEVFRWDFLLYDWAVERFRNNLRSLEFGADLDRYRAACSDQYKDRLDPDGQPVRAALTTRSDERVSQETVARLRAQQAASEATLDRLRGEVAQLRAGRARALRSSKQAQTALAELRAVAKARPARPPRSRLRRLARRLVRVVSAPRGQGR